MRVVMKLPWRVAAGAVERRMICPHASAGQRHWCTWESSHQFGRLGKVQLSQPGSEATLNAL